MPQFEFDNEKNKTNKEHHGIDFIEAQKLWDSTHVVIPAKHVLGENRSAVIGKIWQGIYVAIFTTRNERVRIISCHKADKRWVKIYERYTGKEKKQ